VIKLLLSRAENEIRAAVDAFENAILKFGHGAILDGEGEVDATRFAG
jgi:hypothetical protein